MKQLFNSSDFIGKTISDTLISSNGFWIKFTDNTFTVLIIEDITKGYGYTENTIVVSDWEKNKTFKELLLLGLITDGEHSDALDEEEREYDKWVLERDKKEQQRIKEYELEEYLKLQKKYGK